MGINDSFSIGGIDAGVGISVQITRAESVYDLYGLGTNVGFSVGDGGYFGIDGVALDSVYNSMNSENQDFDGVQFTVGSGVGVDVHVNQSFTEHSNAFNIKVPSQNSLAEFYDEMSSILEMIDIFF